MKLFYKSIGILSLGIGLVGCKTLKAVDATVSMPDEMHAMQSRMDETNALMLRTYGQIERSNKGIQSTVDGVHLQTLIESMDRFLSDRNTEFLNLPIQQIPFVEKFAKEATGEEIAQLAYIWKREIQEVSAPTDDSDASKASRDRLEHTKEAKISALQIIASRAPHNTIADMVNEQIDNDSYYKDAALGVLALRFNYTKSFFLEAEMFDSGRITIVGDLDEASARISEMEYIANLPCARMVRLSLTGFTNEQYTQLFENVTISSDAVAELWNRLLVKANDMAGLYTGQASVGPDYYISPQFSSNSSRYQNRLAQITASSESWHGRANLSSSAEQK